MGQIRIGMRAIAATTADPGEIVGRTNDLLLSIDSTLLATCTFVRFDPHAGELCTARAGHVAAVWATTDGRSGITQDAGGLPLGVGAAEKYPVTRHPLTAPGAFVLVTDGVVEGPSFPIDEGLDAVVRLVAARASASAEALADEVMQTAERTGHQDDAAVLVLRHKGFAGSG